MGTSRVQSALRDRLKHWLTRRAGLDVLRAAILFLLFVIPQKQAWCAEVIKAVRSGGIAITGSGNAFSASMTGINALGAGSPPSSVNELATGGGTLYYTTVGANLTGASGSRDIYVAVTTDFAEPTLTLYTCPAGVGTCTSGFTELPSGAANRRLIDAALPNDSTATFSIGVLVASGSTFSGTGSVTLTIYSYDGSKQKDTCTLTLAATVYKALRLTLSFTRPTDYGSDFGNINALGVGAPAGTLCDGSGCLYVHPYTILPEYSGQGTTLFRVDFYVSSPFARDNILTLKDSAAASPIGSFADILESSSGATTVNVSNGVIVNRYLGLYLAGTNGTGITTGADSAVITYTLLPR